MDDEQAERLLLLLERVAVGLERQNELLSGLLLAPKLVYETGAPPPGTKWDYDNHGRKIGYSRV